MLGSFYRRSLGPRRKSGASSSRFSFPGASSRRAMPSKTFGSPSMDLRDLVRALLGFDALAARQWLADAQRSGLVWAEVPAPLGLDPTELAAAAGVAELLASRSGQSAPDWTATVPPSPK